jgi:hypothetical protein
LLPVSFQALLLDRADEERLDVVEPHEIGREVGFSVPKRPIVMLRVGKPEIAQVLGISPDKPEKLAKFRERDGLTIPLLSDPDKGVLKAYGAFGEKKLYGKVVEGVIRSTFVVDEDGRVEVAQYNVKATGHVAKLRRDLGLDS